MPLIDNTHLGYLCVRMPMRMHATRGLNVLRMEQRELPTLVLWTYIGPFHRNPADVSFYS